MWNLKKPLKAEIVKNAIYLVKLIKWNVTMHFGMTQEELRGASIEVIVL